MTSGLWREGGWGSGRHRAHGHKDTQPAALPAPHRGKQWLRRNGRLWGMQASAPLHAVWPKEHVSASLDLSVPICHHRVK